MKPLIILTRIMCVGLFWSVFFIEGIRVIMLRNWRFDIFQTAHWNHAWNLWLSGWVIDTPKEALAIKEARKLGIPVIGITDTNANPNDVDYPVPGNDDAIRAIQLYCELVSSAILDGMQAEIAAQGVKVDDAVNAAADEAFVENVENA